MFDINSLRLPPIAWNEVVVAASLLGLAVVGGLILHKLIFGLLLRLTRLSASSIDEMIVRKLYRPMRLAMVAIAVAVVAQIDANIGAVWQAVDVFAFPIIVGWLTLSIARALAGAMQMKVDQSTDIAAARSRRTRISLVSRVVSFVIILLTIGWVMLGIPGVREIGVTLMASAGLAALAVGAAAQPALKSLIAGLQMAITEPLRIGDLVVVDGHTGRVEEIRMSFVIVRTWDERAVVVPTANFLDTSFENWSRKSEALTGPVFLHLDPATEIEPIREEFLRFLGTQELWDQRTGTLLMTEAHPESVELRLAMSADTIGDLFNLRCAVREHMIEWLRSEMPGALIRHRLEVEAANARVAGK
ncbi:hypothetical protein GCM10009127_08010 [Alteraurantiacibacter aestuarii]|uniref:Mechanosensitive ion channel n=1 Tax=Alteraurantiacibacter aestuarii TaxID=650004 RepID=A0A844ZI04_9SPHN|nr:mechanosensitive ion channel domain-containing protein [Alteraurantiacibacter aestuarii]MXO87194.1 mechanosensitive ion channel [Alteraurantiacibacter aestuarii]